MYKEIKNCGCSMSVELRHETLSPYDDGEREKEGMQMIFAYEGARDHFSAYFTRKQWKEFTRDVNKWLKE